MKIRINNYKLGHMVFIAIVMATTRIDKVLTSLTGKRMRLHLVFDKVNGANYQNETVDEYYLIQIRTNRSRLI